MRLFVCQRADRLNFGLEISTETMKKAGSSRCLDCLDVACLFETVFNTRNSNYNGGLDFECQRFSV